MVSMLNGWALPVAPGVGRLVLCLAALVMTGSSPSTLAGKHAYGEKIVRVGQTWEDAIPARYQTAQNDGSDLQDEGVFEEQVAVLEEREGPYSDALAEPLAGLGRHYWRKGDLEQAMRLYRRALHVVRVNDGLYSERQMPILRELLDAYRVTGDLKTLDDRYEYYFRLYGKGLPPFTDIRVRATLAYMGWQREAIRLGIEEDEARRLLALYQLNEEQLTAIGADPGAAPSWYRDLVLSQVRNLYLLEDRFAATVENIGLATSLPMISQEWQQEDFNKRRMETLQRGGLSHGAELLSGLIGRTAASGNAPEIARLHLELGDWYQWHGKESQAAEQYQQVVQLLTQAQRPQLVQEWLGEPVELPDNGAFWQPRPSADQGSPVVVQVSYDVSARGRVSNMQASVADPDHEGAATRLKRKLGQIRFRPRWASGEAEPVSQLQRDYQLVK